MASVSAWTGAEKRLYITTGSHNSALQRAGNHKVLEPGAHKVLARGRALTFWAGAVRPRAARLAGVPPLSLVVIRTVLLSECTKQT